MVGSFTVTSVGDIVRSRLAGSCRGVPARVGAAHSSTRSVMDRQMLLKERQAHAVSWWVVLGLRRGVVRALGADGCTVAGLLRGAAGTRSRGGKAWLGSHGDGDGEWFGERWLGFRV